MRKLGFLGLLTLLVAIVTCFAIINVPRARADNGNSDSTIGTGSNEDIGNTANVTVTDGDQSQNSKVLWTTCETSLAQTEDMLLVKIVNVGTTPTTGNDTGQGVLLGYTTVPMENGQLLTRLQDLGFQLAIPTTGNTVNTGAPILAVPVNRPLRN